MLTLLYKFSIVTIFCSIYAIFDEKKFPKYTKSYVKEHKLYDNLLNKISLEIELSIFGSSKKNEPALVPIPHIFIPLTKNNLPTHSPSFSLSYKSSSLLPISESKKLIVKIK